MSGIRDHSRLVRVAKELVGARRGILAADESTGTIGKRLAAVDVESTEETRRAYRGLLFGANGAADYISGVILYDETIRQKADDGTPFPERLADLGIHPGIKVDAGAKPMAGAPDETITEGLDGLRERLAEYRELGATFTKWRAVLHIGEGRPSERAVAANAEALARYAALAQEAGLVPIVEPEVLMDGTHGIRDCFDATERTLHEVFRALYLHRVFLPGMLLKPNMVVPGGASGEQVDPEEVARETIRCLRGTVPSAVPGIVFLSGGQSATEATYHLNEMNQEPQPWELSFSYGRALQEETLRAWAGKAEQVAQAEKTFLYRASLASKARSGEYRPEMEPAAG